MRLNVAAILCAFSVVISAQANGEQHPADGSLPMGSKIYVAPMPHNFDSYVLGGLQVKKVPVVVVRDRSKADYEVSGLAESDKAGWAKMLLLRTDAPTEKANIKVVNLTTGKSLFTYAVVKPNTPRGMQSTGEAVAKHIKQRVEVATLSNHSESATAKSIPTTSRIYFARMPDELSDSLKAAILAKGVPVTVVNSRDEAEFEITGQAEMKKPGTAQKVLLSDWLTNEKASIQVASLKTDEVVFAYSLNKQSCASGYKNTAEIIAMHLKEKIRSGM